MKKQFISEIIKKYSLNLIILFGSRANNTQRSDSDYDIAIKSKQKLNSEDYFELMHDLTVELNTKVDLIDLRKEQDPLIHNNIARNSKLIYEKEEGLFDDFQVNAIFNYIDYSPLYKIEEEIINEKLAKL